MKLDQVLYHQLLFGWQMLSYIIFLRKGFHENRLNASVCSGSCYCYSVPGTLPQSSEAFVYLPHIFTN